MDSKEVIRKRAIITEVQSGEVVDSTECIAVAEDMKEDIILLFTMCIILIEKVEN